MGVHLFPHVSVLPLNPPALWEEGGLQHLLLFGGLSGKVDLKGPSSLGAGEDSNVRVPIPAVVCLVVAVHSVDAVGLEGDHDPDPAQTVPVQRVGVEALHGPFFCLTRNIIQKKKKACVGGKGGLLHGRVVPSSTPSSHRARREARNPLLFPARGAGEQVRL